MSYRYDITDLEKLKDLKKGAIEKAAQSIVSYMEKRGLDEVLITTKHYKQRGDILVYFKPHSETQFGCIAELNYDYPNTILKDEIFKMVSARVMEKRKGN